MKILLIKLGAMGDVMRMTSVLAPLKEKYRGCDITWVTKKSSIDLLTGNPYLDRALLIGDVQKGALSSEEFDLVLSFDDEEEACGLATDVKSKKIIGAYLKDGKRVYTSDSSPWFDMGLISRFGKEEADRLKAKNTRTYQDIHFTILGLTHPTKFPPLLVLDEEEKAFGAAFAKKHHLKGKVIGINTGAGGRWQDKKLSTKQSAQLIDMLHEKSGASILLFGGPDEEERNREIITLSKTKIIDAGCHNPVREFAALVGLCDVVVTSDSLAMHIAIALKRHVVAFFYPTSAAEIEMYELGEKIVAEGKSYCSYKAVCDDAARWDVGKIASSAISLL